VNGLPILVPDIGEVMPGTPAEKVGLLKGDKVIEVNGISVQQWDQMTEIIHENPGKQIDLKIRRNDTVLQMSVQPEKKIVKDIFGQGREVGLIGIKPSGNTVIKKENASDAFADSVARTGEISVLTLVSIVKLIQRVIPMDTIGGPILIVQMAGEQASKGLLNFFIFMAIININLGVLNLLPIPILDGGHILFLGIEAIRRKPLSEKVIALSQKIGLAIILTLMAFVIYNDFMRLITGKQLPF